LRGKKLVQNVPDKEKGCPKKPEQPSKKDQGKLGLP